MTDLHYPHVLLSIVERHFEELDFLWERRENAMNSAEWTVGEVLELESRAFANLE